jgi:hypothetical protein
MRATYKGKVFWITYEGNMVVATRGQWTGEAQTVERACELCLMHIEREAETEVED